MISILSLILGGTKIHASSELKKIDDECYDFANEIGMEIDESRTIEMRQSDGTVRYLYISFLKNGYMIFDKIDKCIIEYSREERNSFIESAKEKQNLYYVGPLGYYEESENNIFDLKSKKTIGGKEVLVDLEKAITKDYQKQKANQRVAARSYGVKRITGTVPNYSYNENNTCGSTASAMWLKWYDNYVDNRYVPGSIECVRDKGVVLCKYLISYIDDNWYEGSDPIDVVNGIQKFLKEQGISYYPTTELATISMIYSRVASFNRPYILLLSGAPTYGNHWVTGYGYEDNSNGSFAIVNNGWGNREIYINLVYAAQMVY